MKEEKMVHPGVARHAAEEPHTEAAASAVTEFAIGIRMARESRGLSLSAAARAAGITKSHLHDMEAGRSRNPCVSTLAGLAKAYCIPLGWFAEQAARSLADAERSEVTPRGREADPG